MQMIHLLELLVLMIDTNLSALEMLVLIAYIALL